MNTIRSFSFAATLVLVSPCFVIACAAEPPTGGDFSASGTLEMPLSTSVDDHVYRLNGYLYLYGPTFQYVNLGIDAPSVSVSLPTGDYVAALQFATLERDDGTGSFAPVEATLVSSSSLPFKIYNGTTSTIAFEFETDGVIVRVGTGGLDIRVDVTETPAVCTPFTDDCGDGAWCPSSELTGQPRACVTAGPLLPGEACASPLECAADSSCFDFGDGPSCASLCPAAQFGEACLEGGECLAAGSDYGVCTPTAAIER